VKELYGIENSFKGNDLLSQTLKPLSLKKIISSTFIMELKIILF
jgi:hypothetical protein